MVQDQALATATIWTLSLRDPKQIETNLGNVPSMVKLLQASVTTSQTVLSRRMSHGMSLACLSAPMTGQLQWTRAELMLVDTLMLELPADMKDQDQKLQPALQSHLHRSEMTEDSMLTLLQKKYTSLSQVT